MMNASKPPLKESSIQQVINVQIVYLFLLLITMSSISALCKRWEKATLWYIPTSAYDVFGWSLTTFIILYNNVIPISLQITLELVKVLQAGFVSWDEEMLQEHPEHPEHGTSQRNWTFTCPEGPGSHFRSIHVF